MPNLDANRAVWETGWDWGDEGEQWSAWWGGTDAMWWGALRPRLHAFLPAQTILEIAPGYGRWTQYLRNECERLVAVDVTERCIEHCRQRFSGDGRVELHVNDGRTLGAVESSSIDLAFSFDSLVHVDADVLGSYLDELGRVLAGDGVAFLHHSNLGGLPRLAGLARRTPPRVLPRLIRRGLTVDLIAWRDESTSAAWLVDRCAAAGLVCVGQELITWEHGRFLIDCISVVTRPGSRWERERVERRNTRFGAEARRTAELWAATSFPGGS